MTIRNVAKFNVNGWLGSKAALAFILSKSFESSSSINCGCVTGCAYSKALWINSLAADK